MYKIVINGYKYLLISCYPAAPYLRQSHLARGKTRDKNFCSLSFFFLQTLLLLICLKRISFLLVLPPLILQNLDILTENGIY